MGTTQQDSDIINSTALWKLNRQIRIDPSTLGMLSTLARTLTTSEEVLHSPLLMECLLRLLEGENRGIRLAMASTILHLYCPKVLPIVDERSYRQTGLSAGSNTAAPGSTSTTWKSASS